jgi:hypothetical protein
VWEEILKREEVKWFKLGISDKGQLLGLQVLKELKPRQVKVGPD